MKNVQTTKFTFPRWEGQLYISLFNGGGGDGFEDNEIDRANAFIQRNRLTSLLEVKDLSDNRLECTFAFKRPGAQFVEYIYLLFGKKAIESYSLYGLLPYGYNDRREYLAFFLPFETTKEKDEFIQALKGSESSTVSLTVVDNLKNKLNIWWKSLPQRIRLAYSVYPDLERFWSRLDISTKKNLYNYTIIRENNIQINEDDERSLLIETMTELAALALEFLFDKPLEDMCDDEGCYLDKYQKEFNRLYDGIEDVISCIEYSTEDKT